MLTIRSVLYRVTDWRVSRLAFPFAYYLFQPAQTENGMRKRLNSELWYVIIIGYVELLYVDQWFMTKAALTHKSTISSHYKSMQRLRKIYMPNHPTGINVWQPRKCHGRFSGLLPFPRYLLSRFKCLMHAPYAGIELVYLAASFCLFWN